MFLLCSLLLVLYIILMAQVTLTGLLKPSLFTSIQVLLTVYVCGYSVLRVYYYNVRCQHIMQSVLLCIVAGCTQRTPTHLPFPCAESGDMKGMMQESLCPPPNTCSHTRHAPRARYFFALPSEPLNNGHIKTRQFVFYE